MNTWTQRWDSENPFSALLIRSLGTNDFVGYIVMGFGEGEGTSEIAYILRESYWGRGFGYESVGAVSLFLSRVLMKNQFKVNANQEFKRVTATSNILNVPSQKILEKCGFKVYTQS